LTEHILRAIEAMTGIRYVGCPWKALDNSYITQCSRIYRYYEMGNLAAVLSDDDEEILWQYLESYIRLMAIVRSKQFDEEQERRKQERLSKVKK